MNTALTAIMAIALLILPTSVGTGMEGTADARHQAMADGLEAGAERARVVEALTGFDGFFLENRGQVANPDVRFYAMGDPLSVGFAPGGAVFMLSIDGDAPQAGQGHGGGPPPGYTSFRLSFVGARQVEPSAGCPLAHTTNFFIGDDPSRWVEDVGGFAEVRYGSVFDGVDIRFRFAEGALKYDIIVAAGARPEDVVLAYEGVSGLSVDKGTGDLLVQTGDRTIRDSRPVVASMAPEGPVRRAIDYVLLGDGRFGYVVPPEVASSAPFVIDPGLRYSTLFGSASNNNLIYSIALDGGGNAVVTGMTFASDFPTTPGAYNRTWADAKGYVAKFDPTLSTLLFSTFYGGDHQTETRQIGESYVGILPNQDIVLVGDTTSDNFPTTADALNRNYIGNIDLYITVLSSDGGELVYSSYFGGRDRDQDPYAMLGKDGSLYVCGQTNSADLPSTSGVFQRTKAKGSDLFVAKLSSSLEQVEFLTYFGGSDDDATDWGNLIGLDSQGNVYFAGEATSNDLPTTEGAFREDRIGGSTDIFLAKLSPNGSRVLYCTYIGGSVREWANYMRVSPIGEVSLFGWTGSSDFPWTSDAFDIVFEGNGELFYLEMDSLGMLTYCTLFGGNGNENLGGVAYDEARDQFLLKGWADSPDLPTTRGCYDPYFNGGMTDFYICAIKRNPPSLAYCTYIGGADSSTTEWDVTRDMAVDGNGTLYAVGYTSSVAFPTTKGAYCRQVNGTYYKGVIFAIDPTPVPLPPAPDSMRAGAGDGYVNVTWDPVQDDSYATLGYSIYRGLTEGSLSLLTNVTDGTSYNDSTDIVNGKRYYYAVSAINSMGEGPTVGPVMARPMGALSEPLNLSTSTGEGTVVLRWEPPAVLGGGDVLGYHIWRGSAEDLLEPLVKITNQTTYTDTDVVPGTTYWYVVAAFNEKASGTQSSTVRVRALAKSSMPQSLEAVAGNGWVLLSWAPPGDRGGGSLLGYNIYRGLSQAEMAFVRNVLPSELSFNDTGVVGGEYHYYYLVAVTEAGEGDRTATIRALPTGKPDPPTDLAAEVGDEQVRLYWSAPANDRGSPVTDYKVYSGYSPGTLVLIRRLDDIRQFPHKGLTNGVVYWYAVSAVNANGESRQSEPVNATPYGLPGAPQNLTSDVEGLDRVVLSWRPPKDCGGSSTMTYRLMRGTARDRLETLLDLPGPPTQGTIVYNDTSVMVGTTYFYSVQAISLNGLEGPRSNSIEVLVALPPGPVIGLEAEVDDGWVGLRWSPPTETGGVPLLGYVVMRAKGEGPLIEVGRPSNASYEDTYVDNDQTYRYAVYARNVKGTGLYPAEADATPMARPNAPEGLKVTFKDGKAVLRWKPPAGGGSALLGYTVLKGTSLSAMAVLAELPAGTEYVDKDVEAGHSYYYSVRARNAIGEGAKATPVKLEVPKDTGMQRIAVGVLGIVLVIMVVILALRRRRAVPAKPVEAPGAEQEQEGPAREGRAMPEEAPDDGHGAVTSKVVGTRGAGPGGADARERGQASEPPGEAANTKVP